MFSRLNKALLPKSFHVRRLPEFAGNSVALTFDDGPLAGTTENVLERLRQYSAVGIFFMVGARIKNAPQTLQKVVEDGHVIGNHSYAHRSVRKVRFREYMEDVLMCQHVAEEAGGILPVVFRPPRGELSVRAFLAARAAGLRIVTWSLEVQDWKIRDSVAARCAAEALIRRVRPRDIVLLHDDNRFVLDILDIVLPAFKAKGFDLSLAGRVLGAKMRWDVD